jgi:hypothetical protein
VAAVEEEQASPAILDHIDHYGLSHNWQAGAAG